MKDPEYNAVDVLNCSDRELTVVATFSCENTIEFEDTAHWAVEMLAPLSSALQLETDAIWNAEVKVSETSKFVLKDVMALRRMEYCELAEAAVLGEAEAEATVKLSCASADATRKSMVRMWVSLGEGGMLLI